MKEDGHTNAMGATAHFADITVVSYSFLALGTLQSVWHKRGPAIVAHVIFETPINRHDALTTNTHSGFGFFVFSFRGLIFITPRRRSL